MEKEAGTKQIEKQHQRIEVQALFLKVVTAVPQLQKQNYHQLQAQARPEHRQDKDRAI